MVFLRSLAGHTLAAGIVAAGVWACSADAQTTTFGGAASAGAGSTSSAGGSGIGGAGGAAGAGGSGASGGSGGGSSASGTGGTPDFDYEGTGGAGGGETCAASDFKGKKPPVDIVFVVDTSGSMSTEIAQVKANINGSFASVLGKGELDYRVFMVSDRGTSTFQICVQPPLGGPSCDNNPPIFRHVPQIVGSVNALSLILSTYDSANAALSWKSFLRYDATKVFILVTDDNSTLSSASFDSQLLAKQPSGMFGTAAKRKYVVYGIIGIDKNNPNLKCPAAVNNGPVYQQLVTLTKGQAFSECEADYSPIFNAIATNVIAKLSCEYALPVNDPNGKAIDPQKVTVKFVDGMNPPTPYTRVNDASQCGNDLAWYYEDNLMPNKILLCPAACTQAQNAQSGAVTIDVGCLDG